MPAPSFLKMIGNAIFFSQGLQLPTKEWQEKYYKDRKQEDGEQGNAPQCMPPWFVAPHPGYKYQQDTCDKIGKNYKDFHDTMIDAFSYAITMWKAQCKFKDLKVMAVAAIGTPGCLDGPELESLIKNAPCCASFSGNMAKHRDAVAQGASKCFKDWQDKVMIPGLPLFPLFAAFPGPMAPPTPNVPVPLIACLSALITKIAMPKSFASAMDDALDGGLKDKDKDGQYKALHLALGTVFSLALLIWLPQQQVMLVMGKGQIPTFAPPFVPVGPVVMGDNLAVPGHLLA
jgi:hypothetical protein